MRSLVAWSLRFRLLVALAAAGLLVVGAGQLRDAPVDVLPEFTPPYVEIQTEALGLSAAEVEQLITVPLEGDLLNGVAGIDVIRSESVAGLSSIVLVTEPGVDLLGTRQLVQERLTQAHALPNVSSPPAMLQPLSSSSRVMMIGVRSEEVSMVDLGLLARWTIRPRLLGVAGVANVVIWGQREHQLQVQVDPERLRESGVSLQQIVNTTGNSQLVSPLTFLEASTPGSGGFVDTPSQRLQVRHILPIATPEGLAQVPVTGAADMRLGDVASIVEDHQPLIGDASVADSEGLLLVVEKFPGANTLEVTRGVEDALDALRPGLAGVDVDSTIFRPANSVEAAIDNLTLALLVGAVLLALALAALLFEWRLVVISLVPIPLAVLAAALVLTLRGETMNALVFAGVALAVVAVVDDAIVGVENTWRRLRERRGAVGSEATADIVTQAAVEVRSPLAHATLVVLLALVPVFFLEGIPRAFFEPLAVSFALAVLASMVVALTVTPALSFLLLRSAPLDRRDPPLVRGLKRGYGAVLSWSFRGPAVVAAAAGLVALFGIAALPLLDRSLVPTFKDSELLVHFDGAPGTSRPEMVRITTRVGRELRAVPGVRNVGAHVGRAVMSDQVSGINSGELWVSIDPDADYEKTVRAVREIVDGYPGVEQELITYSSERVRAVGAVADGRVNRDNDGLAALVGRDEPLVVRLYGNELDVLREKAGEVRDALASVAGIGDPRVEAQAAEPTLEIEVDLAAAGRAGVNPGDVRRAAATLVQGIVVGALFEEQKVFDVVVLGVPGVRASVTTIRDLLVESPSGGHVRLGDVAEVRVAPAPVVIEREAASRRIDVLAGVRDRDLDSAIVDVERRLQEIDFPLEYRAEVLEESTERQAAARRVVGVAVVAAIAIFLVLQAAFGSWRLAAIFLLTVPLAVSGGVLAAFALGGALSLGTLTGLFAVFGLAVRNGTLMIGGYQRLGRSESVVHGPELVVRGAEERLTATVTTALAVGLALLPVAVLGDRPGLEIAHPLAVVVLGGLVTSTFFTLVLVPALYLRFAPKPKPERLAVAGQPAGSRVD
ncbi:MAG: efflux RND transporter permease subunit [Gaiellaceae bacterium]